MKLIDKEKLLEDLKSKRYSKQSLELIQSQPEVEAIPIEWIKELIEEFYEDGIDSYAKLLGQVITEWEKENG